MNLYEKLLTITAELNAVAKNLKVGEGRSSYKAVGEADVLAAVKPLEVKYKVYSFPCTRRIIESTVLEKESTYNGELKKSYQRLICIETTYRFVNCEEPSEFIEITTYGDGIDPQDKAPGKAMTYADKYALLKAYKIITGDDPDQTASDKETFSSADRKDYSPPAWKSNDASLAPMCADCGAEITVRENDYSVKRHGRPLCRACQSKSK